MTRSNLITKRKKNYVPILQSNDNYEITKITQFFLKNKA